MSRLLIIGLMFSVLYVQGCGTARAEGAEVYGYNVQRLANAIYHAEGGAKTRHPYGILTKYKTTTPRQACINTIVNQGKRHAGHDCGKEYLVCLRDRYCPIGAKNDPTGLNHSWINNVKQIYASLIGQ